jgi:hypothetical protein
MPFDWADYMPINVGIKVKSGESRRLVFLSVLSVLCGSWRLCAKPVFDCRASRKDSLYLSYIVNKT